MSNSRNISLIKIPFYIIILLLLPVLVKAQQYAATGNVGYEIRTPVSKMIATNDSVKTTLNTASGKFSFKVFVPKFHFVTPGLPERVNQSASKRFHSYYYQSDSYPDATYTGTIDNIKAIDFKKDGTTTVSVTGTLTMHGKSKKVKVTGTINVKDGIITMQGTTVVNPADYGVRIPETVGTYYFHETTLTASCTFRK
jgi:hypothetical protein